MRRLWTLSGGLATAASFGILALALRPLAASPPRIPVARIAEILPAQPGAVPFAPRGTGSCAAAACHGGATPLPPQVSSIYRNEHTTWIDADPHAQAFDVLLGERSRRIARNLAGNEKAKYVDADKDARCLACHATPSAGSAGNADLADMIRRDGVGCESCHGPSASTRGGGGGWLSQHTTVGWKDYSADQKAGHGFNSLRNLETRVRVCTGCHVGAPADPSQGLPLRDVNHDLIAAGHPRLNWEFSAYVANYPKHWRPDPGRDLDARLWKIGQAATARAAVELLQDRCERASHDKAPWPELSESGCFSCHFGLKDKPYRGLRDPGTPLGVPSWASWHLPGVMAVAGADPKGSDVVSKLADIRKTMATLNPDAKLAGEQAEAAKFALDAWLRSISSTRMDASEIRDLISALNARDDKGRPKLATSWDSAAQVYLGLAALHASLGALDPAGPDPAWKAEAKSMLDTLRFPRGFDSPKDFGLTRP